MTTVSWAVARALALVAVGITAERWRATVHLAIVTVLFPLAGAVTAAVWEIRYAATGIAAQYIFAADSVTAAVAVRRFASQPTRAIAWA